MIDPLMQAEAMMWAWCSLMHRKHHTHSTNEFLCTNYRECGKCGSYVVSRNRKLERAKEQKDFERQRAVVRTVYAPDLANTSDDKLSGRPFPPASTRRAIHLSFHFPHLIHLSGRTKSNDNGEPSYQ